MICNKADKIAHLVKCAPHAAQRLRLWFQIHLAWSKTWHKNFDFEPHTVCTWSWKIVKTFILNPVRTSHGRTQWTLRRHLKKGFHSGLKNLKKMSFGHVFAQWVRTGQHRLKIICPCLRVYKIYLSYICPSFEISSKSNIGYFPLTTVLSLQQYWRNDYWNLDKTLTQQNVWSIIISNEQKNSQ